MTLAVVHPQLVPLREGRKLANNNKSASREQKQLQLLVQDTLSQYHQSSLSKSISSTLRANKTPIIKLLSLGLGSLTAQQAKESQPRRIKQLSIFLAIAATLQELAGTTPLELYAQDPAFSRTDEALLSSLGVKVLRTSSLSDLGEAGRLIDESTLVYSPFLTVEAYELLLNGANPASLLIGDDFEALQKKWPKHSAEKRQVDTLVKKAVSRYQRRPIKGAGFWNDEDKSFPLALYRKGEKENVVNKARI
jgi:hypothetical protein